MSHISEMAACSLTPQRYLSSDSSCFSE